ncbi:hypothetical protein SAMN05216268_14117 [Streptomyces yunnanensis]|uniref:Uncharacterized protein n=1 Tax=Streptomyces yunnanensis TaxID=156453 RepID=A0A9X8N9J7_9ACTN|nr:hypothetical protein SAMN05216268_14117 [Streptomyces yunnanensis]
MPDVLNNDHRARHEDANKGVNRLVHSGASAEAT